MQLIIKDGLDTSVDGIPIRVMLKERKTVKFYLITIADAPSFIIKLESKIPSDSVVSQNSISLWGCKLEITNSIFSEPILYIQHLRRDFSGIYIRIRYEGSMAFQSISRAFCVMIRNDGSAVAYTPLSSLPLSLDKSPLDRFKVELADDEVQKYNLRTLTDSDYVKLLLSDTLS